MIIALIAYLLAFISAGNSSEPMTTIPPMPMHAPTIAIANDDEWELYNQEAYYDYASEFTALFDSYEIKHTKNNRMMIRTGNSGSFKFVKKG